MKLLKKFVMHHQIEYVSSTNKMHLPSPVFCVLHMAGISQNSYNKQLTNSQQGGKWCLWGKTQFLTDLASFITKSMHLLHMLLLFDESLTIQIPLSAKGWASSIIWDK